MPRITKNVKNVTNRDVCYTYKFSAPFHALENESDRRRRYHDLILIPDEVDGFVQPFYHSEIGIIPGNFSVLKGDTREPLLPSFHLYFRLPTLLNNLRLLNRTMEEQYCTLFFEFDKEKL